MPQVLINREQLPHLNFDVELLGDCDVIINELCHRLGGDFEQLCFNTVRLTEITEKPPRFPEQLPSEVLPASSDTVQEEQEQNSTHSVVKPSEDTENLHVTETAGNNLLPPVDLPAEGVEKEEAAEIRNPTSNLEFRRRFWISRINRSPISKRLDGEPLTIPQRKIIIL